MLRPRYVKIIHERGEKRGERVERGEKDWRESYEDLFPQKKLL